jgi:hypothetical protein
MLRLESELATVTLLDLFTGHFTWLQLFLELAPIALVGGTSYFAGYMHGRHVEAKKLLAELEGK